MSEEGGAGLEGVPSPAPQQQQQSPGLPPSLLPLPGREEKQQVQAAMAMAAFYSQSPLWQAALARQHAASLPHPALGRPALPGLPGLPGLAGLLSTTTTSNSMGGVAASLQAAASLEQSRQDLFRDYLTKLAQSSLQTVSTSLGAPAGLTPAQYLQSVSTSVADIKTESPVPATLVAPVKRSSSPPPDPAPPPLIPSYFPTGSPPYFPLGAGRPAPAPAPAKQPATRSPPGTNGGRRNGSTGREKVFTCNICNRSFGYKHVLQNHERTHTGEKPFECKECHKRFTRDHHLKTHMRLHTGEKPYSCTHCDRQFVQVANLRRHLRVHTGERPYKCTLCPSDFSDSNQLKAHMLIHNNKGEWAGPARPNLAPTPPGPSFSSLKEELLFRHSLAQGFPLPQYPLPVGMAGPGQEEGSSQGSPDSKETAGSGDGSDPRESLSDSNSEKRRSRKQKPRKLAAAEEEGGRDSSPVYQQEPEDLTVRAGDRSSAYLAYRAGAVSEFSMERRPEQRNRSEGSDGSLTASDPLSAHSTPGTEKFRSDDLKESDEDKEEDERGVSPPMSHPSIYNPLFGGPGAIQLGLAGAAVPINREFIEKESEMLSMVAQKEISQQ